MFSKARSLDPVSKALVDAFFAAGGQITICPTRRARSQSDSGWNRRNDRTREGLGLAHD